MKTTTKGPAAVGELGVGAREPAGLGHVFDEQQILETAMSCRCYSLHNYFHGEDVNELVVVEAPTVDDCFAQFVASYGVRSVAYTETLAAIRPLVTLTGQA